MGATQPSEETMIAEPPEMSIGDANRHGLRMRIDELIHNLCGRGDEPAVQNTMHTRRWREQLEVAGVDSGQLTYADNLVDEAHSILRRDPANTAAAIEELRRAREKLT